MIEFMENIELSIEKKTKNKQNELIDYESRCLFKEAIDKFINLLNSQMDSFPILNNTLAMNVKTCANRFTRFIEEKGVKTTVDEDKQDIT